MVRRLTTRSAHASGGFQIPERTHFQLRPAIGLMPAIDRRKPCDGHAQSPWFRHQFQALRQRNSVNIRFARGNRPVTGQRRPVLRASQSFVDLREPVAEQARDVVPPCDMLASTMWAVVPVEKRGTASPPGPVYEQRLDHHRTVRRLHVRMHRSAFTVHQRIEDQVRRPRRQSGSSACSHTQRGTITVARRVR